MSVNDLPENWTCAAPKSESDPFFIGAYSYTSSDCARDLQDLSSAAWHPVSDPPTEEDGDEDGYVLVRYSDDGKVDMALAKYSDEWNVSLQWARIRDVVLLPPED